MKTSNKLLLGFLILALTVITVFAIGAKIYLSKETISGNGRKTSETRQVSGFDKIRAKGRITIFITQGTPTQIKIDADENLIPFVKSEIKEGELTIRMEEKIKRDDLITVYITADSNLNVVGFSAATKVETPEGLIGNTLKVETSAGAQVQLKLKYNEILVDANSGGDVILSGVAEKAIFNFSSGGNIDAKNLEVENGEAEGSSGGNASIKINKALKIDVSSGANLDYSGNAMITNITQSSGGNISKQ